VLVGLRSKTSLVYRRSTTGTNRAVTLQWLDGTGKKKPLPAKAGDYGNPRLSPDGKLLAVTEATGTIQVYDFEIGRWTHVAGQRQQPVGSPIWTPDGQYLVFTGTGGGISWSRWDHPDQTQALTQSRNPQRPVSFGRDGKLLAYVEFIYGVQRMFILPIENDGAQLKATGKAEPFHADSAILLPRFSRDGRWLAYTSDETGTREVDVSGFPSGGTWKISDAGGAGPVWSQTTDELFYQSGDQIIAVNYSTKGDRFVPEKSHMWAKLGGVEPWQWDLSPDGKRVLVLVPVSTSEAPKPDHEVTFILNFFDYLRQRVPVNK